MTTADGSIVGTTKVIDHGDAARRWNMVILGDGYQLSELEKYHTDALRVISVLSITPPFDQVWNYINIFRVDVASTDSGADNPAVCADGNNPVDQQVATYFDSTFCFGGLVRRTLYGNAELALKVAGDLVPQFDVVLVIVNSSLHGGSGGLVSWCSAEPFLPESAIHELGHTFFGLGDEYGYPDSKYVGDEPANPNLTTVADPATAKWAAIIKPGTPAVTNPDSTCATDTYPDSLPPGTVGLFEGGGHAHCGLFRPEYDCKMRTLGTPFCAVCQMRILDKLAPYGANMSWDLKGNVGTDPATDFIGTTDAKPLIVKTSDTTRILVDAGGNVCIGSGLASAKLVVSDGDILLRAADQDPGDLIFQDSQGTQKARIWSYPGPGNGLYLSGGDNTPAIAIDSAGDVFIGGTGRPSTLEVCNADLIFKAAGDDPGDVVFQNSSGVQKARIWSNPGIESGLFMSGGDNTPALFIDPLGNLLFGSSTRGSKFEINNADLILKAAVDDPGDLVFQSSNGEQKARIWSNPGVGSGLFLSGGDNTPGLAIDSNGNLYAGTPGRAAKIEIFNGTLALRSAPPLHRSSYIPRRKRRAEGQDLVEFCAVSGIMLEWGR